MPKAIIWFGWLLLASIAIEAVKVLTGLDFQTDLLLATPAVEQLKLSRSAISGTILGALVLYALIAALLWYFIARRASVLAKWIFVGLVVFAMYQVLTAVFATGLPRDQGGILTLAELAASWCAAVALFLPGAQAWFAKEDAGPEIEGETKA